MRALESGLTVLAADRGFQVPGARARSKNLHLGSGTPPTAWWFSRLIRIGA